MRKVLAILFSFLGGSCALHAQEKIPCWVSGDSSEVITSQGAMLMTYLLPIDLDDPQGDAEKRIKHGDFRLIGVGNLGIEYPGLNKAIDGQILCEFGGRYIQGTSDVYEGKSHAELASAFAEYAKEYNVIIIDHYRSKKKSGD